MQRTSGAVHCATGFFLITITVRRLRMFVLLAPFFGALARTPSSGALIIRCIVLFCSPLSLLAGVMVRCAVASCPPSNISITRISYPRLVRSLYHLLTLVRSPIVSLLSHLTHHHP